MRGTFSLANIHVIQLTCGLLLGSAALNAQAADAENGNPLLEAIKNGKSMSSLRLRYEHVNQEGLTNANALTLRTLLGWQTAPIQGISLAAQLIDVSKLQDHFNDGTPHSGPIYAYSNEPGQAAFAKIVDPSYTGVNQLYVNISAIPNTSIKFGRQQTNLDNVRFIGDIAFRQVMQVFDGVSVLNKSLPNTEVYLAHFEALRQINTKRRSDGALDIANVKYRFSPTESITAYGYFSGFDDLGFGRAWLGSDAADQSNRILGARLDGAHPLNDAWKLLYTAEFADQKDYAGGDSRIDAHYYKLGGGAGYGNFSLRADQELLSSNDSQYAFQSPFGTNHLFQGWVDKFLTTPKQGIRDTFITATYQYGNLGLFADYHWIHADERFAQSGGGFGDAYGTEWNAAASYQYSKQLAAKLEYGRFSEADAYAAGRIKDTEKVWLTASYSF